MTQGVTVWAAALCTAAIGCTLLQMLAPKGSLGRVFKLITAAFFVCCMAAPILSAKNMFTLDFDGLPDAVSAEVLQERVKEQFGSQVTVAMQKVVDETLASYNLSVAKVEVTMDTDENNSIYISDIILYLDKQNINRSINIKQIMERRLGVEVSIRALKE